MSMLRKSTINQFFMKIKNYFLNLFFQDETIYLLSGRNKEVLLRSLAQAKSDKFEKHDLIED